MVVHATDNFTLSSLTTLQKFASAGLPIILAGGSPGFYPLGSASTEEFNCELQKLEQSKNVYKVDHANIAEHLSSIGLSPRVGSMTNGTWYTTWYEAKDISYAFIFNDLVSGSGEVTINSTKTPYFYNAWTGERSPVIIYTRKGNRTTIPLELAGNQTVIIAFSDNISKSVPTPKQFITSAPPSVIGATVDSTGNPVVHITHDNADQTIQLSSGKQTRVVGRSIAQPFALSNWTLVAEHWEAPDNMTRASVIASKRNTTHHLPELLSWDQSPALMNVSGLGFYSTSFEWCSSKSCRAGTADGAYLTLGHITETARVFVNGKLTAPFDIFKPEINISEHLKNGKNEVLIIAPTIMWNYLKSILPELKTAGSQPYPLLLGAPLQSVETGLTGTVTVTPYKSLRIS